MTNRWTPVEIDAATAGPDFWTRYHAYRRLRLAETRPDDPIRPDRVIEDGMKRNDPFEIHYRYEISDGAKMLSWFSAEATRPGAPGYDTSQHLLWVEGSVHRDHRRRGIGQSWIPLVLEIMNRQAYTTVGIECEEESGHAFLRWIGAEAKFTGAENRLKLADVDWAMMRRWVEEGRTRSPETKFESYDGRLPESMLEDYAPQLSSMLNTMPWEDLDHGESGSPAWTCRVRPGTGCSRASLTGSSPQSQTCTTPLTARPSFIRASRACGPTRVGGALGSG